MNMHRGPPPVYHQQHFMSFYEYGVVYSNTHVCPLHLVAPENCRQPVVCRDDDDPESKPVPVVQSVFETMSTQRLGAVLDSSRWQEAENISSKILEPPHWGLPFDESERSLRWPVKMRITANFTVGTIGLFADDADKYGTTRPEFVRKLQKFARVSELITGVGPLELSKYVGVSQVFEVLMMPHELHRVKSLFVEQFKRVMNWDSLPVWQGRSVDRARIGWNILERHTDPRYALEVTSFQLFYQPGTNEAPIIPLVEVHVETHEVSPNSKERAYPTSMA